MKRNLSILIILSVITFSGCKKNEEENQNQQSQVPPQLKDIDPSTFEEVSEKQFNQTLPHLNYCKGLGYEIQEADKCKFSQDSPTEICDAWDFLKGECNQELTYCQTQGFEIKTVTDKIETGDFTYAICVFDDGSECEEYQYYTGQCQKSQCQKYKLSEGGCVSNSN